MDIKEEKKDWSWLDFLFMPYDYVGYEDLTKVIITVTVLVLFVGIEPDTNIIIIIMSLLIGIAIALYAVVKRYFTRLLFPYIDNRLLFMHKLYSVKVVMND